MLLNALLKFPNMLPVELANGLAEPWAYAFKLLEYCVELNNTRPKISKQKKNVLAKSFAVRCLDNSKGMLSLWTAYHLELIPFLNSYTNFSLVLVFWNLPML
jgi:hypothetical protein